MDLQVASATGIRVNTIVLTFTLLAGMVVFLRLFTKLAMSKSAGFEDLCIVIAMAFSIALAVMTSEQVMNGLGKQSSSINTTELEKLLKAFWASLWIYSLTLTVTKVSILIQYLHIFSVRLFRKACYCLLAIVIAYGAWALFSNIFLCNPVMFMWDKSVKGGHCLNELVIWFTNAGINIALDLIILLLPLPTIPTLQISAGQKKGLVVMFSLGASVTLVSILRLHTLDRIANSEDVPFDNTTHAALSAVEANVGIVCACLPAMRPLLALIMPGYFSATARYGDVPTPHVERSKHLRTPSSSAQSNISRGNRVGLPKSHKPIPLELRNDSKERIPVVDTRIPTIVGSSSIRSHSRSTSNTSLSNMTGQQKLDTRLEGRMNPLRMSPVTALSPPLPVHLSTISPLAPSSFIRTPTNVVSNTKSPSHARQLSGSRKPLPITPFPVSQA
ncbi:hypothetical protein IQ07DRAFT_507850 [Pyrenochaeta sp. DS3sAY3a]|nr:hypothetical protein IQ07DRAFT_507850 [Pyrenochaeta sp. DS3sAY3a]